MLPMATAMEGKEPTRSRFAPASRLALLPVALAALALLLPGAAAAKPGGGLVTKLAAKACVQQKHEIGNRAFRKRYGQRPMPACIKKKRARGEARDHDRDRGVPGRAERMGRRGLLRGLEQLRRVRRRLGRPHPWSMAPLTRKSPRTRTTSCSRRDYCFAWKGAATAGCVIAPLPPPITRREQPALGQPALASGAELHRDRQIEMPVGAVCGQTALKGRPDALPGLLRLAEHDRGHPNRPPLQGAPEILE